MVTLALQGFWGFSVWAFFLVLSVSGLGLLLFTDNPKP